VEISFAAVASAARVLTGARSLRRATAAIDTSPAQSPRRAAVVVS
jgi:hypothetical protein